MLLTVMLTGGSRRKQVNPLTDAAQGERLGQFHLPPVDFCIIQYQDS